MRFHYSALQPNGKKVEGELDVAGTNEVLMTLASKGLTPVSIKKINETDKKISSYFGYSISIADKIFLTKYLSLMLKIGTDLFKAIDILMSDFDKPGIKKLLYEIRQNLEKGQPFHLAFEKYPQHFSPVFVSLLKAGESSGNLEATFSDLSVSLQKEQDLKNEIRSALTYPILLIVVAVSVVFFLATFALPKISKMFNESGFKPPVFSQIVFAAGNFLNEYVLIIIPFIFIAIFGCWYLFTKNDKFKKILQRFVRRMPLVGDLLKKIAIQRFASTLASLLSSGIPILEALETTADAVGDEELKESLIRISREGISKGLTVGDAFKKETVFPKVITNLIVISEKSGNLGSILLTVSDFYESDIKSSIKILISFLEPALLLVIGVVVAVIALAIIVPIYQLVGNF